MIDGDQEDEDNDLKMYDIWALIKYCHYGVFIGSNYFKLCCRDCGQCKE